MGPRAEFCGFSLGFSPGSGFGCRVLGFRVYRGKGLGFRGSGLGFRVQGLGFSLGLGLKILGLGFRTLCCEVSLERPISKTLDEHSSWFRKADLHDTLKDPDPQGTLQPKAPELNTR